MSNTHEKEVRGFAERLRSMASVHPVLGASMLDAAQALDVIAGELYAEACGAAGHPRVAVVRLGPPVPPFALALARLPEPEPEPEPRYTVHKVSHIFRIHDAGEPMPEVFRNEDGAQSRADFLNATE